MENNGQARKYQVLKELTYTQGANTWKEHTMYDMVTVPANSTTGITVAGQPKTVPLVNPAASLYTPYANANALAIDSLTGYKAKVGQFMDAIGADAATRDTFVNNGETTNTTLCPLPGTGGGGGGTPDNPEDPAATTINVFHGSIVGSSSVNIMTNRSSAGTPDMREVTLYVELFIGGQWRTPVYGNPVTLPANTMDNQVTVDMGFTVTSVDDLRVTSITPSGFQVYYQ